MTSREEALEWAKDIYRIGGGTNDSLETIIAILEQPEPKAVGKYDTHKMPELIETNNDKTLYNALEKIKELEAVKPEIVSEEELKSIQKTVISVHPNDDSYLEYLKGIKKGWDLCVEHIGDRYSKNGLIVKDAE